VATIRLQTSDRRVPGMPLRLHRVGGVCGVIASLPDTAVFVRARIPGSCP